MTHFTEVALGAAVIATLGAGAMALLLQPEPATSETSLPPVDVALLRAEPLTDAQRFDLLQLRLAKVGAEQRRLIEDLKAAALERKSDDIR
jgi:hypothetical protein